MTEEDRKLFRRATETELQVVVGSQRVRRYEQAVCHMVRVMRARWVLTWKSTGKTEARTGRGLAESVASNWWKLVSGDITSAFLSGDKEHRNIFRSDF